MHPELRLLNTFKRQPDLWEKPSDALLKHWQFFDHQYYLDIIIKKQPNSISLLLGNHISWVELSSETILFRSQPQNNRENKSLLICLVGRDPGSVF